MNVFQFFALLSCLLSGLMVGFLFDLKGTMEEPVLTSSLMSNLGYPVRNKISWVSFECWFRCGYGSFEGINDGHPEIQRRRVG